MSERKPHILLVEEDDILSDVTSFRLELLGYRVTTVKSGAEAVRAVAKDVPAAIIVDLELTDMRGLELIEVFGRDEQTTHIPVMALSFDAELESVQQAFRAGAIDYLVCPYDPQVLETKVEQLVTLSTKAV